jgi:BNR/Asp-box repeat
MNIRCKSQWITYGVLATFSVLFNTVSADTGGGDSGKITWKMVSPYAGAGYKSVAVHPKNANIAYCSIDMLGVYKTIDGGRHWTPIGNDDGNPENIWRTTPHGILIDPQHPDTVYVGHRLSISKSTDGGKTWKIHKLGHSMTNPRSFACDPLNTKIIYASHGETWNATNEGFKESWPGYKWAYGVLIKTRDGGESGWQVRRLVFPPKSMAYSIIPDPTWPGNKPHECMRIYASTNKGFYISNDAGETWSKKNGKSLPHDRLLGCVMEIDKKKNTPILYLLVQRKGELPGGLYKSVDRGESWVCKTDKAFPKGTIYGQIAYGQLPGVIYVTTPAMIVDGKRISLPHFRRMKIAPKAWKNNAFGVFKTVDGGETWQTTTPNPDDIKWGWDWYNKKNKNPDSEAVPYQLGISPANPNIVYYTRIMAVSYDGGKTLRLLTESEKVDPEWKFVRPCGLSGGCISCVVVGPKGRALW